MEKYYKFENGLILKADFDEELEIGLTYCIAYDEDNIEDSVELKLISIADNLHEFDYNCSICGDIENLEEVEDVQTKSKEFICGDCLNG